MKATTSKIESVNATNAQSVIREYIINELEIQDLAMYLASKYQEDYCYANTGFMGLYEGCIGVISDDWFCIHEDIIEYLQDHIYSDIVLTPEEIGDAIKECLDIEEQSNDLMIPDLTEYWFVISHKNNTDL